MHDMGTSLHPYQPDTIDRWLKNWPALVSLAETPRRPGTHAVVTASRVYSSGARTSHADTVADLETAMLNVGEKFGRQSAECQVLEYRLQGHSLRAIAGALRVRTTTSDRHYWGAVRFMAESLGWKP